MSHPTPENARKQIVEIIGNSVYHALGLKESLQDEFAALEAQDMDALRVAVDNKSSCVAALQTLEQQRKDFCIGAGFESGPEQMEQLAEWCDEEKHGGHATMGGSFNQTCEIYGLPFFRVYRKPDAGHDDVGFRCVRD